MQEFRYKDHKVEDRGDQFWIYRPDGSYLGVSYYIEDVLDWIDWECGD